MKRLVDIFVEDKTVYNVRTESPLPAMYDVIPLTVADFAPLFPV